MAPMSPTRDPAFSFGSAAGISIAGGMDGLGRNRTMLRKTAIAIAITTAIVAAALAPNVATARGGGHGGGHGRGHGGGHGGGRGVSARAAHTSAAAPPAP